MTARPPLSSPGVHFPPPFLFFGGVLLGWFLDRYWRPLPLSSGVGAAVGRIGVFALVVGVGLAVWGMLTFRRARTAIVPNQSASQLVTSGPYRFTRNPMYVGLTIAYVGVAAMLNSAWLLILLPVVLIVLIKLVITREELYLIDAFGEHYTAYRARVRRWL